MHSHELSKLAEKDALVSLPCGATGVRVTLQFCHPLTTGTRDERREALRRKFVGVAREIERGGGIIHFDSISVLGQTVTGAVPADHFDQLEATLKAQGIRVDVRKLEEVRD